MIAEADGRDPHSTPGALFDDRQRQNRLTNAGWTVLRFTWPDTLRPDYIPQVVRQALAVRDQALIMKLTAIWISHPAVNFMINGVGWGGQ